MRKGESLHYLCNDIYKMQSDAFCMYFHYSGMVWDGGGGGGQWHSLHQVTTAIKKNIFFPNASPYSSLFHPSHKRRAFIEMKSPAHFRWYYRAVPVWIALLPRCACWSSIVILKTFLLVFHFIQEVSYSHLLKRKCYTIASCLLKGIEREKDERTWTLVCCWIIIQWLGCID